MVKYITWGLIQDPFKGYPEQFIELKVVHNMDIDTNSNGNSNQVGNQVGNLTVIIGSDPFLPQPYSLNHIHLCFMDENLNTPPLPSPSVTLEVPNGKSHQTPPSVFGSWHLFGF